MIFSSKPKIAIIGSGVAGLSAAHYLQKKFAVSIFEHDKRIGGHTNTVKVLENEKEIAIDTGFIVMNHRNYPNFSNLFLRVLWYLLIPSAFCLAFLELGFSKYCLLFNSFRSPSFCNFFFNILNAFSTLLSLTTTVTKFILLC